LYLSQIWLKLPVYRSHFGYITKLRRGREGVGRWQTVGFLVSCVQQAATAKLGRRGVQLARPYLSCRKRQGNKKKLA